MRKNNLKKFMVTAGLVLGVVVTTTDLNTGVVTAASVDGAEPLAECKHSYVYVFNGSSIRHTYTHPFLYEDTGEWMTCTRNIVVDSYIGRCTKCGIYGGQGYTKERDVHLHPSCPTNQNK
ncbi:MAG: hypothetical protein OSJ45_15595 [Lachnospiraceae bacterium]|nr:hypothetical protein [Lachnospiraceae bacterium]